METGGSGLVGGESIERPSGAGLSPALLVEAGESVLEFLESTVGLESVEGLESVGGFESAEPLEFDAGDAGFFELGGAGTGFCGFAKRVGIIGLSGSYGIFCFHEKSLVVQM